MRTKSLPSVLALTLALTLSACGGDEPATGGGANADSTGGGGGDIGGGEVTGDIGGTDTADAGGTEDTTDTATADVDDTADTSTEDVPTDTGVTCPGADGCECKDNGECDSGVCLDTHEGKKCAAKCVDTCPNGYACKDIGDGDPLFYCVSELVSLCAPCKFHSDCQVNGVNSLCLDYGTEGSFCGSPCQSDTDCPADYACSDAKDGGGAKVKQCKRKAVGEAAATCGCSDWATAKGLETECAISNEFGTCKATRKCGAEGLSACAAKTPASEVCNELDDDCDGDTDNLPAELGCTVKAFLDDGSKVDCKSDGDCKTKGEACDASDGKCKTLIGACPGKPACGAGGKLECTEAKTPTVEACNGEDDDCDGAKDEDFAITEGGASVAVGASCGQGACAGGTVVCTDASTAACSTADKAGTETCDDADNDCDGQTDNAACDDGDACTTDTCDGAKGTCDNKASVDCDDGDACTTDSCDKATGTCKNEASEGSCDDGDACTESDTCVIDQGTGKSTCTPGKTAKDCDDSNPCTDDSCDKATGCKHSNNSGEVECYNGADGTAGVGICIKGKQICKDGQMLAKCEGEIVPASSEACDGKDNDCDGTTDEGCKPTDVAVTFAAARVQGKAGNLDLDMLVGRGAPAGKAAGAQGSKFSAEFGFYAWLSTLLK
ncbi:MAG: hypothetical protein H6747_13125 [Deltaproteobacteria bacterium]|nr:hypothetical protein [Deltaproteobacteria bacterium]